MFYSNIGLLVLVNFYQLQCKLNPNSPLTTDSHTNPCTGLDRPTHIKLKAGCIRASIHIHPMISDTQTNLRLVMAYRPTASIQWGGAEGPCPPSSGKVPQILDQMPPESGQKCPHFAPKYPMNQGKMPHICTKVSQFFSKMAQKLPFEGQIFKILPRPPNYMVFSLNLPFKCKPHTSVCAGKLPSDLGAPPPAPVFWISPWKY